MSPAWQRDLLLDAVPALVRKYGDIAATAAAQWYEQTRAQQVDGSYEPVTADSFPDAAIQNTVRWQAGNLFNGNTADMAAFMNGALNRWVQYSGRETVARNIIHDSAKPRYARVPSGYKTCAFCSMLASRGFVYYSETSAGEYSKWHADCHCQVVPEWDKDEAHIEGYDPDQMYSKYMSARDSLGEYPQPDEILATMRRLYPNDYTDGVVEE